MYSGLSGEVYLTKVTMFGRTSWSAKLEKAKLEISKHTHTRGRSYAEIDQWLVRFFYV